MENGNGKLPFVFCKRKTGVSFPWLVNDYRQSTFAVSANVPIYAYNVQTALHSTTCPPMTGTSASLKQFWFTVVGHSRQPLSILKISLENSK
jgi:hypothetical protein